MKDKEVGKLWRALTTDVNCGTLPNRMCIVGAEVILALIELLVEEAIWGTQSGFGSELKIARMEVLERFRIDPKTYPRKLES